MAVSKFNTEAMEQCRTTVSSQAGQYGAIGDGFANQYGDPGIFGKLTASAGISTAVGKVDEAGAKEFAAAETVLGKVERTLDAVQQSVTDVEDTNKQSFRTV